MKRIGSLGKLIGGTALVAVALCSSSPAEAMGEWPSARSNARAKQALMKRCKDEAEAPARAAAQAAAAQAATAAKAAAAQVAARANARAIQAAAQENARAIADAATLAEQREEARLAAETRRRVNEAETARARERENAARDREMAKLRAELAAEREKSALRDAKLEKERAEERIQAAAAQKALRDEMSQMRLSLSRSQTGQNQGLSLNLFGVSSLVNGGSAPSTPSGSAALRGHFPWEIGSGASTPGSLASPRSISSVSADSSVASTPRGFKPSSRTPNREENL